MHIDIIRTFALQIFKTHMMKNLYKLALSACFVLMGFAVFAQGTITGKVIDLDTNEPLPGASIGIKGTQVGAFTDMDGNFSVSAPASEGTLVVSFIGYNTVEKAFNVPAGGTLSLGNIGVASNSTLLGDVKIVGVADVARDRKTPVAVSTIKASEIQEKLGSQEFPEILRGTPSVYVTKQGGGFGDARINIRGFDQRNTAVMINGVPVNDMENGWVYWSNWAGLSDVTTAMQVQRGLGSSKLAISSVGGTINVLTRSADQKKGGAIGATIGNDGYIKGLGSYSTGLLENGFSASVLLSRTSGDGYVDGTMFEGYNYFLGFGYRANENNDLQLTITGAPQWHHQRDFAPSLGNYIEYGDGSDPDHRYNGDWGYLDDEEFSFRRNFYHKPIASLNWDLRVNDRSKISTSVYASVGRGGGTGEIGTINGSRQWALPRTADGLIRVDDIMAWNTGQSVPDFAHPDDSTGVTNSRGTFNGEFINTGNGGHPDGSGNSNGITRRASVNSHNWYGVIANYNTKLNENLTFDLGIDARSYRGLHYRRVESLMGADAYIDYDNMNFDNSNVTPSGGYLVTEQYEAEFSNIFNVFANTDDEQKIDYYNDGEVRWLGAFTQLEYSRDELTFFIQGGVSQQGFKRVDYFNYLDTDDEQASDFENLMGGNIKGGVNYNLDKNNNVFFNTGYYSKQPLFDAVYPNYTNNNINTGLINEKIFGLELGYGYRSANYRANVNLYRTSWADRFLRESNTFDVNNTPDDDNDDIRGTANLEGIKQVHQGIEVDGTVKIDKLRLNAMGSFGNYEYKDNVTARYFDDNENEIIFPGETDPVSETLYLDGVKVGDVAHITTRIGAGYEVIDNLNFDISFSYFGKLYADIDASSFNFEDHDGSLELPSYSLVDAGLSYKFVLNDDKNQALKLRLNINNVLDEIYISESETNRHADSGDDTWNGINTRNRVFFGFGRTWNLGVRYEF